MSKADSKSKQKGLKQILPTKFCAVCGKPMQWRKSWAKNWDTVLYCSERCKRSARSNRQKPTQ